MRLPNVTEALRDGEMALLSRRTSCNVWDSPYQIPVVQYVVTRLRQGTGTNQQWFVGYQAYHNQDTEI